MLENALNLGPHATFIWSAYAVTAVCVIGLTIGVVGADRRQRRLLADLEARGITRRSATKSVSKSAESASKASKTGAKPQSKTTSKPTPKSQTKPQTQAKRGPNSRKAPARKTQAAKRTASRGSK
ncbi:heme exporter protein CcmD [Methyloligella solikamskensis]|uniref:Heme exporter protein D n=1 Tax=Methyloligella solikamskensis TaxID=1177756 RepID=A0ABW3J6V8_9HYPH